MEQQTPTDSQAPQPPAVAPGPHSRIPSWVYAIALVAGLILLSIIISMLLNHHSASTTAGKSPADYPAVALKDNQKVDTARLPAARTLFFTMMQRTAEQPNIAGPYGEGYYQVDTNVLTLSKYQYRDSQWQHGVIGQNYVDLPWDPAQTDYSLTRCIGGAYASFATYAQPPAWKPGSADDSKTSCDIASMATAGETNTDGMLTGGLTQQQAVRWVNQLAAIESKVKDTPLFSFDSAQLTTLDGKTVIRINTRVNPVVNTAYCRDFSCGQELLSLVLKQQGVNTTLLGYDDDLGANSSKATYLVDPQTLLPLQSQVSTFDQKGQPAKEYRKQFDQFSSPGRAKLESLSTAVPASRPAILDGFHNIEESGGLAPPPGN